MKTPKNTLLSVVIVKYKCDKYLKPCLNSIKNKDWEIIVVDNDKENLGYGGGCNKGATFAKGKYLLFLNPDTEVLPGALERMVAFMEENPEVGVLGPRLYTNRNKDKQLSFSRFPGLWTGVFSFSPIRSIWPNNPGWHKYSYLNLVDTKTPLEVEAVSGAALMVRRNIFEQVGGFDRNFFLFFEENDLCRRIQKLGHKIMFLPQAEIIHWGSKSMADFSRRDEVFRQSRAYFFKKHLGLRGIITEMTIRLLEKIALAF
jgi:GT2 family glycosyltransferase